MLADMLHVDRGSVTALVKCLEAPALVTRKPDVTDGRRVLPSLTAYGKNLDDPRRSTVEHAVASVLQRTTASDLASGEARIGPFGLRTRRGGEE